MFCFMSPLVYKKWGEIVGLPHFQNSGAAPEHAWLLIMSWQETL